DDLQRGVVDRGRHEPRLERARRQVHAAAEHRVEESAEGGCVLGTRAVEVGDLGPGEEDREHVAGGGQPVRYPGGGQRLSGELADGGGRRVQGRVDLGRGQAQAGQAGGAGQRVAGEGTGLVHGTGRGEPLHDLAAATERRGGQPAAHHL